MSRPVALTIAGSDPSGGAGIQADLKTFHHFSVYGEAVVTLLTVQNSMGVGRVEIADPDLVEQQIRAVLDDIPPQAGKLGALGSRANVERVAELAAKFSFPLIVDPVMVSKHGAPLMDAAAVDAFRALLLPRAFLVTPNLPEAGTLAGMTVDSVESMRLAAEKLVALGARAAIVKGGHLETDAVDVLFDGRVYRNFTAPRVASRHTHGTGCAFSAAIAACLAHELALEDSISRAKQFVTAAIQSAPGLGSGAGPLNFFA